VVEETVVKPRWLEISMTVDSELAEAVSEVLARFVANGIAIEGAITQEGVEGEVRQVGPLRVYGFIPVDEHLEEKRLEVEKALWHLNLIQTVPQPVFRFLEDQDWMAVFKQHYHPIPVGNRLLILPAWIDQKTEGRIPVKIDPSMAFGTGTHPTTQMCLELLETYTPQAQPIIDVGCGSGILSIAAVKLGAAKAISVDIDTAAVRSTGENAEINGVVGLLETGEGSVEEILKGQFSLKQAPLVVANILLSVILKLFGMGLADLVNPGGNLILSGLILEQADTVDAAARKIGLNFIEKRQMGDWIALVYQKV
jgi:ribosomal protein L11 methyltransferase